MLKHVVASFILKGEHQLVRKLHKAVAFDTRFSLYQDGVKHLYLLDVPMFDNFFEIVYKDGKRKLLSDKDATELLKQERDFNERVKQKAVEQLSRVKKFSRMSELQLDPEEQMKEEVKKESPEAAKHFKGNQ